MGLIFLKKLNIELIAWALGIVILYNVNPESSFTICPLAIIGFKFCPGCGLGHGIHFFLHGQWTAAIQHHWLSPVVALTLCYRIIELSKQQYFSLKH
ncbi:DUF2752 domain-containing protein [Chitinophaga silvatica]|uniref:DUF2752 domain-containing protein n=1 Tax=Chitinophaga silvatica TaxID=2282649 RepID=A0A3E1YCG1_9BACT|nr:DUF2752 domain-containing protein [Chitinophaga silvatica]RFS23484.1 DUF2752 domain-containing protein [Chitinophaga silvatica]